MRYSYSKDDRISSSKEIEKLFQDGRAFFSSPIKIIVLQSTDALTESRSAVIAPKKILRKAYQRNRIKRLLRETIRHQLPHIRRDASHPLNKKDFLLVFIGQCIPYKLNDFQNAWDDIMDQIKLKSDAE